MIGLVVVASALTGCSAASSLPGLGTTTTVPTTQPPTFEELAAEGEAYEVQLGPVGATPLRTLVTPHPIGQVTTYDVTVSDGASLIEGEVRVEVLVSAADGSQERLRLHLVGVRADGVPEDELAPALGATMELDRDGSRVVTASQRSVPADLTRRAGLAAEAVLDAFVLGAVPLPIPPVGDGATWRIRWAVDGDAPSETLASVAVDDVTGVAVVVHPAEPGTTSPDGVASDRVLDGSGPFGAEVELRLGSTTIVVVRR